MRGNQTYALVREPFSWYISLYSVLMGENSPWLQHLGINHKSDFPSALKRMTGMCRGGTGSPLLHETMSKRNPSLVMSEAGIGLWSWWFLHCCAEEENVFGSDQDLAPVRLLWLGKDRNNDLRGLGEIVGKKPHAIEHYRNARLHKSVNEAYTEEMIEMVNDRDGDTYNRALALPSGLGENVVNRSHHV